MSLRSPCAKLTAPSRRWFIRRMRLDCLGGIFKKSVKLPVSPGKVPIYVMLQLDWLSDDGQSLRYKEQLQRQLSAAKRAGIKGVMAWKPGGFVRCVRPETEQTTPESCRGPLRGSKRVDRRRAPRGVDARRGPPMAEPELLEQWLSEVPKEQPDELWPPPLWPGHFCKKSLLQLRDSSGLAAQSPPYSFAVRYDLRPLTKQWRGPKIR
ncbi:unnamed protein product [Durusdinium trenchii]|uniref:Uncharacterized protein n=1 Tax=Durusdinium trenchii TaxID=1381693 RepID=A0ABP0L721_9DINO